MNCPRCQSAVVRKDGFVGIKQRHYCKSCQYHYTVSERKHKPINLKRFALELHLEGLSNREIKKVLGVSDVSIMNWIRIYRYNFEALKDNPKRTKTTDITGISKMIDNNCSLVLIKINDKDNDIFIVK